jgi:hypothetical protein
VAYLLAALPILLWLGSYRWFFGDEWAFLSNRSVTIDGLFRPHNHQHWVTLPVLAYRGLFSIVGLRAYWPYQLLVISLHLGLAALLRVVMRRAGVGPWIATITAGAFVLLGAAEDNILWAFQITFVGALVAGVIQMILADHDGPIDRRDWIGLGVGFLGLMTSGQAPSLIAAVGVVCVLRKRWRAAVFHTVPLAAAFLIYVQVEDVQTVFRNEQQPFTVVDYLRWMNSAAAGLFMALGHFAPIAAALGAVFVVGIVLAVRHDGWAAFARRAAVPTAMIVAGLLTMSAAAPNRFFSGPETARAGRYIGVMAALVLPALGVAVNELVRRWPKVAPATLLLLLVAAPFNAVAFGDGAILSPPFFAGLRANTVSLPDQPLAHQVPPWVRPNQTVLGQPEMTVGWLLQARRDGVLPPPETMTPTAEHMLPLTLGVAVADFEPPDDLVCETHSDTIGLDPALGDRLIFTSPVAVALREGLAPTTPWRTFEPSDIEITLPDLHLLLTPDKGSEAFELCR